MIPKKTFTFVRGYLRPSLPMLEPKRLDRSTTSGDESDVPALIDRKSSMLDAPEGEACGPLPTGSHAESMTEAMAAKEGMLRPAPSTAHDDKRSTGSAGWVAREYPATDSIQHIRAWFDQAASGAAKSGRSPVAIADYCLSFAEFEVELARGLTRPDGDHARLKDLARKLAANPLGLAQCSAVARLPGSHGSHLVFPVSAVARKLEGIRRDAYAEVSLSGPTSGDTAGAAVAQMLDGVLKRLACRPHANVEVPESFYMMWLKDPAKAREQARTQMDPELRVRQNACILQCELIQILGRAEDGPLSLWNPTPVNIFVTRLEEYQSEHSLIFRDNANMFERLLEDLITNGSALQKAGQLDPEEFERDVFLAARCYWECRMELYDYAQQKLQAGQSLLESVSLCANLVGSGPQATGDLEGDRALAQERAEEVLQNKTALIEWLQMELDAASACVPGLEARVLKALDEGPGMTKLQVARAIDRLEKIPRAPSLAPPGGGSTASAPDKPEQEKARHARRKPRTGIREPKPDVAKAVQTGSDKPEKIVPLASRAVERHAVETRQDGEPDRKARHMRNKIARAQGSRIGARGVPEPAPGDSGRRGRSAWHTAVPSDSSATSTLSSGTTQSTPSTASRTYDPALAQSLRTYKDAVRAFEQAGYSDTASAGSHRKFSARDRKSYTIAEHGALNQELSRNRRKDIAKFLTQYAASV